MTEGALIETILCWKDICLKLQLIMELIIEFDSNCVYVTDETV